MKTADDSLLEIISAHEGAVAVEGRETSVGPA
jgi:hypothetical protein